VPFPYSFPFPLPFPTSRLRREYDPRLSTLKTSLASLLSPPLALTLVAFAVLWGNRPSRLSVLHYGARNLHWVPTAKSHPFLPS